MVLTLSAASVLWLALIFKPISFGASH